VTYQRNANFATKTLLDLTNNPISNSIDPFVFKVTPGVGRVVTVIANNGNFGHVCLGSFVDEELTINNGGDGELLITNIVAAPADFQSPSVLSYPIKLEVGDAIDIPIRFAPLSLGPKVGTITVFSNDPASPHVVSVSGDAPAPRLSLAIANSGNFGKVCVGSFADEPLVLNNSGHCPVTVFAITSSSGAFLVPEGPVVPAADRARRFTRLADPLRADGLRSGRGYDHGDQQRPRQPTHGERQRRCAGGAAGRYRLALLWRRVGLLPRRADDLHLQHGRVSAARDQRCI